MLLEKKEEKKGGVSNSGAWAMNVISSVAIIMANKQVMSKSGYDFRFGKKLYRLLFTVSLIVTDGSLNDKEHYQENNRNLHQNVDGTRDKHSAIRRK